MFFACCLGEGTSVQNILCYFCLAGVLGRLLFLFSCVVVAVASDFRLTSDVSVFVGPIVRVDCSCCCWC